MITEELGKWLNHPDFRGALIDIPDSFGFQTKLSPFLYQTCETWLFDLIGEPYANLLTALIGTPLGEGSAVPLVIPNNEAEALAWGAYFYQLDAWIEDRGPKPTLPTVFTEPVTTPVLSYDRQVSLSGQVSLAAKFLAHASWSRYVINTGVEATEAGLVVKDTTTTNHLTDAQRSQISRDHKALAEHYALKLKQAIPADRCQYPSAGSGRPQFRTIRSRRRSRFN